MYTVVLLVHFQPMYISLIVVIIIKKFCLSLEIQRAFEVLPFFLEFHAAVFDSVGQKKVQGPLSAPTA